MARGAIALPCASVSSAPPEPRELRAAGRRARYARCTRPATMRALVYHGPGQRAWEDRPTPTIQEPTDAIVRILQTTICGTDLHILKGDVPTCAPGRILGHEGVGVVDTSARASPRSSRSDHVADLVHQRRAASATYCRKGMYSHCTTRRLDPRQHDRRHPGRARPHPSRRHQPLSHSRGRRRGGAGHAQRHPADRLRVRRAQRQGRAGQHGGHRRRRADRSGRAAHGAASIRRPRSS